MAPDIAQKERFHWQPLERLLQRPSTSAAPMPGFDDEFRDIVDYIIKITYRIWEQKDVGLCYRYYSDICPVHTLGGLGRTVDEVVQNTVRTLSAFPDRILIGENVVWSHDEADTYYSSHRITSAMTNSGWSEFGPPTGLTAKVTTIADCVCRGNRVVYEWLVRDNSYLLRQLGLDVLDTARQLGGAPVSPAFRSWWQQEFSRVSGARDTSAAADSEPGSFAARWLDNLFNRRLFGEAGRLYWPNARVEWPGGRHVLGTRALVGTLVHWLAQVPDARVSCDHIAISEFDTRTVDVAVRWTLAGTFDSRRADLASLRGLPALLLGASHLRITAGRISEEWTVFDEVAFYANLFRASAERRHG